MIALPAFTAAGLLAQAGGRWPAGLEDWVALLSGIANIVIALALIAIFAAIIPIALNARKVYGRAAGLMDRVEEQSKPILRHAESVADNIDYVTAAVRSDVEQLKRSLDTAQTRLQRAASGAEERIKRFTALLDVVQDEAENLFIDTASTVRGVRAGARALQEPSPDLAWDDDEDEPAGRPLRPRRHL